jgi:hypothetical protein
LISGGGDSGVVNAVHIVRLWSKPQMLDLLAKHLRLLDEAPIEPTRRVPLFQLSNGSRAPAIRLPMLETKTVVPSSRTPR